MDNGIMEENKVKECLYIQIKMYIQAIGFQVESMDKALMYLMPQE